MACALRIQFLLKNELAEVLLKSLSEIDLEDN